MSDWTAHVRAQARMIVDQIADLKNRLPSESFAASSAVDRYYKMLEDILDRDLRLAQLRDDSDLLLRAEGVAFKNDPHLQLVSNIFSNVTSQVTDLTRAILGVQNGRKFKPSSVDLGLSGIAKGSLYFGLKAHSPVEKLPLLGEVDTLYTSTICALRVIDDLAHTVEYNDEVISLEAVSEVITDPKVRDAALLAVQRITPSGRLGIDTISIAGGERAPAELNPNHRRAIREILEKPIIRGEEIEFLGRVREIDLDARRFDLRGIANEQVRDVRCAYQKVGGVNPKTLLGATIRARGLVEKTADDLPRLMSVSAIEIVHEAPEDLG